MYHKQKLKDDYEAVQSMNPSEVRILFGCSKRVILERLWRERRKKISQF